MAFSYSIDKIVHGVNGKIVAGRYTNTGGSTGGDIKTGLINIYAVNLQPKGTSVSANQPVVNETFPLAIDSITIVTSANEVGTFTAIGE